MKAGRSNVAAHHQAHEVVFGDAGGSERADLLTIAEHGDPTGQPQDLVQPMRDVDDRDTPRGELRDQGFEPRDLRQAQRGRRLVHDHEARVLRQGAGDGDELTLPRVEAADDATAERALAERGEHRGAAFVDGAAIEQPDDRPGLAPEAHVLARGQGTDEQQFLGDDGDAVGDRLAGRGEANGPAVELELAREALDLAGQDADQRGLARAVLPDQRVHLAGGNRKIDIGQRAHAREGHADADRLEHGRHRQGRRLAGRRRGLHRRSVWT